MDIGHLHIAIKTIDFWALFTCIGLLIARARLLPPAAFDMEEVARAWRYLLGLSLIVLTATGLALLLVRIMAMGDASLTETLPMLPLVLQRTHYGHIWGLHLLGLLALWAGWGMLWRTSGRGAAWFMLAVITLTAFTYSASSHAADSGDFSLIEVNDWLHVLSASLWGGGILASALFIFPALRKQHDRARALLGEMAGRLSNLSALALVLVLATGIYNAATRLGSFGELVNSPYGHVLGIKLILVAAMAMIGGVNRFILVPRVQQWAKKKQPKDTRPMQRIMVAIRADAALTLLILSAAAVLIQSMPPDAMKNMPAMEHQHGHSR